jgi:hypothetical protein
MLSYAQPLKVFNIFINIYKGNDCANVIINVGTEKNIENNNENLTNNNSNILYDEVIFC